MNTANTSASRSTAVLRAAAAGLVALAAGQAQAASVALCAQPFTKTILSAAPAVTAPMWGYSLGSCGAPSAPGPMLTVPNGDTTLVVTLTNRLTVPTSIVLAGQGLPSDGGGPVSAVDVVGPSCVPNPAAAPGDADSLINCRVRSFTGETAPGATRTYTFTNLRPGTYLYQSGTHPQVQVQMGLSGMARVQTVPVPGVVGEAPLVLTEIDIAMHQRIQSTLGGANPGSWKAGGNTTLGYAPNYFLINGRVFNGVDGNGIAATDINAVAVRFQTQSPVPKTRLLIANAGLQSRSLVLNRGTLFVLGEDGYAYPAPREQASILMPASKTSDADIVFTDTIPTVRLALFDDRGGAENAIGTVAPGGQLARIVAQTSGVPFMQPIADQFASEGVPFALQVVASGATSYSLPSLPGSLAGVVISNTGLLTWPNPNGVGGTVTVRANNGSGNVARTFYLKVINHKPVLPTPAAFRVVNGSLNVAAPGLLTAATDADGDTMTALQVGALAGVSVASNGAFSYTTPRPPADTTRTFQVVAVDATGLQSTPPTTVTLNVIANEAPKAVNDFAPTNSGTAVKIVTLARTAPGATTGSLNPIANRQFPATLLTANDTDAETSVVTSTLAIQTFTRAASPTGVTVSAVKVSSSGTDQSLPTGQTEAAVIVSGGTVTFTPRTTTSNGTVPSSAYNCMYKITYKVNDTDGAASNTGIAYIWVALAP